MNDFPPVLDRANTRELEHAGLGPSRLYVASFSGWAVDSSRQTKIGSER
jgi:hypothetical protein